MKTTYYVTLNGKVYRATTAISRIKLARMASEGRYKAIDPKTAKKMIKDGAEFIKVQDIY